jgi:hypothetical protein
MATGIPAVSDFTGAHPGQQPGLRAGSGVHRLDRIGEQPPQRVLPIRAGGPVPAVLLAHRSSSSASASAARPRDV